MTVGRKSQHPSNSTQQHSALAKRASLAVEIVPSLLSTPSSIPTLPNPQLVLHPRPSVHRLTYTMSATSTTTSTITSTASSSNRLRVAEQKINEALRVRSDDGTEAADDLASRVSEADEKVPETMHTLAAINRHLLAEMNKLRRLIRLAEIPNELKRRLSDFILAMTKFRTGCLNLVSSMKPTVGAVISGLEEYDEDTTLFDENIHNLLRPGNLRTIQQLMAVCVDLISEVRALHVDISTVKGNVKGAQQEMSDSIYNIGALYAAAAVTMWATFSSPQNAVMHAAAAAHVASSTATGTQAALGIAALLPEIPILFGATAVALVALGVYCWWNWKEVNDALTSGEAATQQIADQLEKYETLLRKAQVDLTGILDNWQSLDLEGRSKRIPKIRRNKLDAYCRKLLAHLESLFESCSVRDDDNRSESTPTA